MMECRAVNLLWPIAPTAEPRFVLIAARGAAATHFVNTAMTTMGRIRA